MSTVYVGIVSDSHGRFQPLEAMVEQAPDAAAWIHCGDYCEDGDDLAVYTGVPVYAVLGNNDYRTQTRTPECRTVQIGSISIVAIHGHQWYGSERIEKLAALGKRCGASLVVFGHTHRRFCEERDGLTILNPGSISLPRDGRKGTYAICRIDDGVLTEVSIHELRT